jgi:integrin beta 3
MKFDGKAFGEAIAKQVRGYVDTAMESVLGRLKAVEERPAPLDGRDGRDGQPGRDGANGADGKDGNDGERGFGLDDFGIELTGDRTFVLSFKRGDIVETHELTLPVMIYRGVYSEETTYERGDTVTWGGAMFHCNGPEAEGEALGKPVEGSKAWTLAVKRGRDGKAGEKGADGKDGRDGKPGIDAPGTRSW